MCIALIFCGNQTAMKYLDCFFFETMWKTYDASYIFKCLTNLAAALYIHTTSS